MYATYLFNISSIKVMLGAITHECKTNIDSAKMANKDE